jgi:hypothetical protein
MHTHTHTHTPHSIGPPPRSAAARLTAQPLRASAPCVAHPSPPAPSQSQHTACVRKETRLPAAAHASGEQRRHRALERPAHANTREPCGSEQQHPSRANSPQARMAAPLVVLKKYTRPHIINQSKPHVHTNTQAQPHRARQGAQHWGQENWPPGATRLCPCKYERAPHSPATPSRQRCTAQARVPTIARLSSPGLHRAHPHTHERRRVSVPARPPRRAQRA